MDLRLERNYNKELVVIRSSSCVIKIRETSSVFKSCHSDTSTSVSQETQICHGVKPVKKDCNDAARSARRASYSEEDVVVERSPACGSGKRQRTSEENSPRKLPNNVLKLIEPSEAISAHSSHYMNGYDMLEILIQVLNELKSDCKSIFEKRESDSDENAIKLIIRECFTEIMVRYSTDSPRSSRSYNRCQKIISRSIKSLTLECVGIIERAICRQAKVMKNSRSEREDTKSLLTKVMQIIQTELNKSETVLKVVSTELHQPSFKFIFELLKYFIEKSALGFKSFCRKSTKKVSNGSRKGAGEVSDNSCEASISVGGQKLDEYASRLDRLLEKVSSEPDQENQLVIDCYHCTTKCKEQDLLLKTVTRFTEEIKQELINHARIVHEGSRYSYIGHSRGRNSRDVSLCSPDVSVVQSHAPGEFPHRSSSLSTSCSPVKSTQPRALPKADGAHSGKPPAHQPFCDARQNSKSHSPARSTLQTAVRAREYKPCVQHAHPGVPYEVKPCTNEHPVKSRPTSPSCLHGLPRFECSSALSKSVPQSKNTCPHGDLGAHRLVNKCRYCATLAPSHKPCAYDSVKTEDTKNIFPCGSIEIFEASPDQLPKPPLHYQMDTVPESHLDRKTVRKEEQSLVKKSKPAKDDQVKMNDKSKQEEKKNEKSVNDVKPSGDQEAKQTNDEGNKGETTKENASLKSESSKKEKAKSKSPENAKQEKKVSITKEPPKTLDPASDKHDKVGPPETGKELKQTTKNPEPEKVDEALRADNVNNDEGSGKAKDPAHCCRMNCNCRNKRGEAPAKNSEQPPKRDSMNQTDQEPHSQNSSCCKGCNCGQKSIPVYMNGCSCKTGDGDMSMRPIYQFFANPVPIPCNCKETPPNKEQKEAQTSKPTTPNRRVSQETGTQTKKQLDKAPSEAEPLSSAPSSSTPSKSAPSSSAPSKPAPSSSEPTGDSTHSSSEPTYLKSSTSQPTSSTTPRMGKSDSMVSCTCSIDKKQSESTQPQKPNMKDACTSDTNCCCPEKIEEVFQEFDDKYSQVVKEIKFLIKEGYFPLNKEETRELTVTAKRSSPQGTSSKTATCRCTQDSCRRCRGSPAAAFSRNPQPRSANSNKGHSNYDVDDECEEGFQSGNSKPPKKQIKYDDRHEEYEPPAPSQYASKDTSVYNELQKDIHDLKELVKNTKFGNCPCCKCCNCEPDTHGKPCPANSDGSGPSHEGAKNVTKPPARPSPCTDDAKQENAVDNQPDKKSEPSTGAAGRDSDKQKTTVDNKPDKKSEPSTGDSTGRDNDKQKNAVDNRPDEKSEPSTGASSARDNDKQKNAVDNQPDKKSEPATGASSARDNDKQKNAVENQPDKKSESSTGDSSARDNEKNKNALDNQPDRKSEPSTGASSGRDNDKLINVLDNQPDKTSEPSMGQSRSDGPSKKTQSAVETAPTSEDTEFMSPSPNEPNRDSVKVDNQQGESVPPRTSDEKNNGRKNEKRLPDSEQQYGTEGNRFLEDPESIVPVRSDDQSKDTDRAEEDTPKSSTFSPSGQQISDPSKQKRTSSEGGRKPVETAGTSKTEGSPSASTPGKLNPNGSSTSSSILKEPSKDKIESRTNLKKVGIDEPPPTTSTGASEDFSGVQASTAEDGFGKMRSPQVGPDTLPQKTVSNISFGSRKSTKSTTSSKNLVLSPEQEALFQSRERLRGANSQVFMSPADDGPEMGRERQYALGDPGKPDDTTGDDQPGVFQRIFGRNTKTSSTKTSPTKDASSSDSVGDSSGDSTVDICRTLLDNMELMPCRFWSNDGATPPCQGLDTYVMVLESETSDRLAARDETFIISNKKPTRGTNRHNENKVPLKTRKELGKSTKDSLVQQLVSKGTSTIWTGITSQIGIIRGLLKPNQPNESAELPIEVLERELSTKRRIRKPAKKLVSPLNVSTGCSHVRMTRSRDRKRRSGGDLRTYSSESFKRKDARQPKTRDKEVQVTKWNAMTQTAGPRKFNRTDISKEIEDKLARYLGLERTVEEMSLSLPFSSNSEDQTVVNGSATRSSSLSSKRQRNHKKRTSSKK